MICRSCGTEIADKALICYRCGTATTEAKYKPAAVGRGPGSRSTLFVVILVVLAIVVVVGSRLLFHDQANVANAIAVVVAMLAVIVRAFVRRR